MRSRYSSGSWATFKFFWKLSLQGSSTLIASMVMEELKHWQPWSEKEESTHTVKAVNSTNHRNERRNQHCVHITNRTTETLSWNYSLKSRNKSMEKSVQLLSSSSSSIAIHCITSLGNLSTCRWVRLNVVFFEGTEKVLNKRKNSQEKERDLFRLKTRFFYASWLLCD